jgi:O-antigen/teichoic acid export membrane protein
MNAGASEAVSARRAVILHGMLWNSIFQVFLAGVNFASMLALVRLLSPGEFGRATAATGVLALINCFNCSYFIAQAIQLREGEEPDWAAHWRAGLYIQLGLFVLSNTVGAILWLFPVYRTIAPLLHVASIGLLVDCPNQMALAQLRRDMNFRTLRLVNGVCVLLTVLTSVTLARLGAGAYALIIGSNVLHGMPFGIYLLALREWRPPGRWWDWPDWKSYRVPLHFGWRISQAAVVMAGRGILESLVLPGAIGYEAIGLLNRAQVLFATTAGRANSLILDTVYPLLPRSTGHPQEFARHVTLFVQTMLLISVPGAVFVSIEGPYLSRLLYGSKWMAADSLIAPATWFAWGVSTVLIFTAALQAANRLRLVLVSSAVAAGVCIIPLAIVVVGGKVVMYAWTSVAAQLLAVVSIMFFASPLLENKWSRKAIVPPAVSAAFAAVCVLLLRHITDPLLVLPRILVDGFCFGIIVLCVLQTFFSPLLHEVVIRLPGRSLLGDIRVWMMEGLSE